MRATAATGKTKDTSGTRAYSPHVKVTREFCDAIERSEVRGLERCFENARQRFAQLRPASCSIGGGLAVFAGINSPLSEAVGVGLWARAGRAEAELLTQFYRDRGSQPRVRLSPHADPDFVKALLELGYAPFEYENPLVADLHALDARRDARVEEMRDPQEWSRATGSAFLGGKPCDESNLLIGLMICTVPTTTALEIRENGTIIASGCLEVDGDIAGFFGAGTAPGRRGQGLQSALISDRAARAIERGARYGRVTTMPGTPSEQNFRRIGFVPLYTRTTWGMPEANVAPL
jgi:GNAT superfamily N-acetyltransferase